MPDASLLTSLFPEEVVTRALVRDVELPDGAGHDGAHHAGQRARPHPAEHVRPGRAAGAERRAGRGGGPNRHRRGRGHRQAVHLRGRRRPERRAADRRAGRGAGHRPARARGVPAARRAERAVVRVRERRRPRRRPGTGAALLVPDDLLRGHRGRVPRVLPRPAARLGRHLPAAAPDRPGERAEGHRREPAQPEPHAARRAGLLARHRRRDVRARRLPGRVAALGGPGADRHRPRCPGRSPRRDGTRRAGTSRWPRRGCSPTASCTAPPRRPTGPSTWWPRPAAGPATRGSPPRTRPSPTCCSARNCGPGSTPST